VAIKLPALHTLTNQLSQRSYIYKDLTLDIKNQTIFNPTTEELTVQNDIEVSYDVKAITNSLRNLFTTQKGQRFLFPLYGLDLRQYLFEPINDNVGQMIGTDIVLAIKKFEPRVLVKACDVVGYPDENTYRIQLTLMLPAFNTSTTINSILDAKTQSFTFLK
jgi:phage baseplate assembly protein W